MALSSSSRMSVSTISVRAQLQLEVLMNTRVRACLLLVALPQPAAPPPSWFWWTRAWSTLPGRQRPVTEAECGTEGKFVTHASELLIGTEETGRVFRCSCMPSYMSRHRGNGDELRSYLKRGLHRSALRSLNPSWVSCYPRSSPDDLLDLFSL